MAESYKYRAELPRVVEFVNRRNALKLLGSLGIRMAENATWEEILDAHEETSDKHDLAASDFEGQVPVNGVFRLSNLRLRHSGISEQVLETFGPTNAAYNTAHRHTRITLASGEEDIEILLGPDVPPVALFNNDIRYVESIDNSLRRNPNDAALLGAVQRAFDEGGVDFINEAAAGSVIHALLNDESKPPFVPMGK